MQQRPLRSTKIGAGVAFLCCRGFVRWLGVEMGWGACPRPRRPRPRGRPRTARGRLARPPPFRGRWGRLGALRFQWPKQRCHSEWGPMRGRRGGDDVRRAPEESSRGRSEAGRAPPRLRSREPAPRSVRFRCKSQSRGMACHRARWLPLVSARSARGRTPGASRVLLLTVRFSPAGSVGFTSAANTAASSRHRA
jgi:hypothetical protein